MKTALLFLLYPIILSAAEPQPTDEIVLRGVFDMGSKKIYSLSTPGGASSGWVETGKSFMDYTVDSYDAETRTLTLIKDGEPYTIGLASAANPTGQDNPQARLEEAKKMFEAMNFKETIGKVMDAQMEAVAEMTRKQLVQNGSPLANDQAYLDFVDKAMKEMVASFDWEAIQTGMEEVYAETFTEAELKGITEFYSTPAGRATVEKTPALQQKTLEVMMPTIMESSQKMSLSVQDYMKQRAKQEKAAKEAASQ